MQLIVVLGCVWKDKLLKLLFLLDDLYFYLLADVQQILQNNHLLCGPLWACLDHWEVLEIRRKKAIVKTWSLELSCVVAETLLIATLLRIFSALSKCNWWLCGRLRITRSILVLVNQLVHRLNYSAILGHVRDMVLFELLLNCLSCDCRICVQCRMLIVEQVVFYWRDHGKLYLLKDAVQTDVLGLNNRSIVVSQLRTHADYRLLYVLKLLLAGLNLAFILTCDILQFVIHQHNCLAQYVEHYERRVLQKFCNMFFGDFLRLLCPVHHVKFNGHLHNSF